jgi:hypothetical protein
MEESEAIQKAKEHMNEAMDYLLSDIIKTKEKLRDARSISDVMAVNKLFMECMIESLPLESWHNPFCWLAAKEKPEKGDAPWNSYEFPREEEDCGPCEYAKVYGNCFQKGSALDKVDKTKWRLYYAVERYWEEKTKNEGFTGCPC